ncbi:hypothetical protein NC652_037852 [Populus alba x Populus x berolinensis]|nr:hypothetical protein NC652_037852 [Populus alba x Populus x berolinensis]
MAITRSTLARAVGVRRQRKMRDPMDGSKWTCADAKYCGNVGVYNILKARGAKAPVKTSELPLFLLNSLFVFELEPQKQNQILVEQSHVQTPSGHHQ